MNSRNSPSIPLSNWFNNCKQRLLTFTLNFRFLVDQSWPFVIPSRIIRVASLSVYSYITIHGRINRWPFLARTRYFVTQVAFPPRGSAGRSHIRSIIRPSLYTVGKRDRFRAMMKRKFHATPNLVVALFSDGALKPESNQLPRWNTKSRQWCAAALHGSVTRNGVIVGGVPFCQRLSLWTKSAVIWIYALSSNGHSIDMAV